MSPTVETVRDSFGAKDFFPSREEYEEFRIRFGEELRPKLEQLREARRKSEEAARKRFIA